MKQVRVNPQTVQNVVTYDAVVLVHDEQERLKPGMTANVTIDVVNHPHVLTVPMPPCSTTRLRTPPAGKAPPQPAREPQLPRLPLPGHQEPQPLPQRAHKPRNCRLQERASDVFRRNGKS
jgi:HlyD family secretion protein